MPIEINDSTIVIPETHVYIKPIEFPLTFGTNGVITVLGVIIEK